jgi:hypothetical protein
MECLANTLLSPFWQFSREKKDGFAKHDLREINNN